MAIKHGLLWMTGLIWVKLPLLSTVGLIRVPLIGSKFLIIYKWKFISLGWTKFDLVYPEMNPCVSFKLHIHMLFFDIHPRFQKFSQNKYTKWVLYLRNIFKLDFELFPVTLAEPVLISRFQRIGLLLIWPEY